MEQSKKDFVVIISLAILLTLPWIFIRPFESKGEPREALTAMVMLESGNYILPNRYGNEFPTKPPAYHWLISLTSIFQGKVSEASSRLPSVLLSLLALAAFYKFLVEDKNLAFVASLILITCIEWHRASTTARVDMALSCFILLAMIELYRWSLRSYQGFPYLLNLFISCAVLTKGPIGLILPGLNLVLYSFLRKRTLKSISFSAVKLLPSLLLPALWYFFAYQQGGDKFLDIVISENLGRITGNLKDDYGSHSHGILYLYGTLFLGFTPWVFLLLFLLKKEIRSKVNFKLRTIKAYYYSLSAKELFCLSSAITIIIFYSIPESKRSVYLLPAYPFISVFIATHLIELSKSYYLVLEKASKLLLKFLLVASILLYFYLQFRDYLEFKFALLPKNLSFPIYLPLISFAALFGLKEYLNYKKTSKNCLILASPWILALVLVNALYLPSYSKQVSFKNFADQLKNNDLPIYSVGERYYNLNFYLNGKIKELESTAISDPKFLLVFNTKDPGSAQEYLKIYNYRLIYQQTLKKNDFLLAYEVTKNP